MANLMKRPSKPDNIRCKKHPKHSQSPGVCSLCLREKLSQLSFCSSRTTADINKKTASSCSSSVSSYDSSSSASSCSSPMHGYRFSTDHHHHQGKNSLSLLLFGGKYNNVLTKSRSLAFVLPTSRVKEGGGADKKLKKGGFFSKLLFRPTSKKIEEGFMRSRTIREITVTS